ncbi:MAG: DNA replication/repair protein RecF [Thermoleophilaceae bacterium]
MLRDFRNYARADVDLAPGLTVICGPNGAGKTNLLEALYFGLTARSCRTSNEREVVKMGAAVARVEVELEAEDGRHMLEVGFEPGEDKRVRVDGAAVDRPAAIPARPLVSVFLPERLELVKGAPAGRRAHLDQFVAALWPARADARRDYSRALAQRNALIARVRAGGASADLLDPWDAELARHGEQLMDHRSAAAAAIRPAFAERAAELGLPEAAELSYRPRSAGDLRAELRERRDSDVERGFTQHGPHRDDLALLHDGRPLRTLGSQGQQRVAVLAMLFAERDVLVDHERPPLMLLDDVMSELDESRRTRLADLVRAGGQAVITTTEAEHVPGAMADDVAIVRVSDGTLAPAVAA